MSVKALAILRPNETLNKNKRSKGFVYFITLPDKRVKIIVNIEGLPPGLHGIHIHEYGDMSNGCISAGPHFNPQNKTHGGPLSKQRHVGDLGNIRVDCNRRAKITIYDHLIKLTGKYSVIGRAVVVHELPDDLGLKIQDPESLITGNAGRRLMCGIIGLTDCFPTPGALQRKKGKETIKREYVYTNEITETLIDMMISCASS